jgi:hypothetical protein
LLDAITVKVANRLGKELKMACPAYSRKEVIKWLSGQLS